jgi:hypothetical protein
LEGKTSSSSRATERIGGPIELPAGIIQRNNRDNLFAIVEGLGAERRISSSASTACVVFFEENSSCLDDRRHHNTTAHPPEAFEILARPMQAQHQSRASQIGPGIKGNNTEARAIVKISR